jgi:hypothetical protein
MRRLLAIFSILAIFAARSAYAQVGDASGLNFDGTDIQTGSAPTSGSPYLCLNGSTIQGCTGTGGGSGTPGGSLGQLQYNAGSGNFGGVTIGGDCTFNYLTGDFTCLYSNGNAFGTAAFDNTGTSGANVPLLNGTNTWSGVQNFEASGFTLLGSSTGKSTFTSANSSGTSYTLTVPAATDTFALLAATQTLTNKTIAYGSNTLTGVASSGANSNITSITGLTTPLTVAQGGTQCGAPVIYANLPGSPTNGEICNVTDATACTAGTAVSTGGGSTKCQVTFNGSAWMPAGGASASGGSGAVSSVTAGTDSGIAVSPTTGAVVVSQSQVPFYVKDYNVKCDGSTNDSSALNTLFTALATSPYCVVVNSYTPTKQVTVDFPAGADCKIPSGVTYNASCIALRQNGATLDCSGMANNTTCLAITDNNETNPYGYNLTNIDVNLLGPGNSSSSGTVGLGIGAAGPVFVGLKASQFEYGVKINNGGYFVNLVQPQLYYNHAGWYCPTGLSNAGENLQITGGTIYNNDIGIDDQACRLSVSMTSFDYNTTDQIEVASGDTSGYSAQFSCSNCHMENGVISGYAFNIGGQDGYTWLQWLGGDIWNNNYEAGDAAGTVNMSGTKSGGWGPWALIGGNVRMFGWIPTSNSVCAAGSFGGSYNDTCTVSSSAYPNRAPSTAYALNTIVAPLNNLGYNIQTTGHGYYYKATTAGTSSSTATASQTWPTSGTFSDGTVVWTYQGPVGDATRVQFDAIAGNGQHERFNVGTTTNEATVSAAYTLPLASAGVTIDHIVMGGSETITIPQAPVVVYNSVGAGNIGQGMQLKVIQCQAASGGPYTTAYVTASGLTLHGSMPSLCATASECDVIDLTYDSPTSVWVDGTPATCE